MAHPLVHEPAHNIWHSLPLILLFALQLAYLWAAMCQIRLGKRWPIWRTLAYTIGIALLMLAFAPPLAERAHASLQGHMIQHLLLGMFAPLGLILGLPLTLTLRSLPARRARSLTALFATAPVRWLIHPVTAAGLNMGGMYLLYLTPLYALSHTQPLIHTAAHLHFLFAGCLFTWAIAGPDRVPHRSGLRMRLVILFLALAAHAILGKLMYGYGFPRHTSYSLPEIEAAAQLMYYGGDVASLLLIAAFFTLWFRHPVRPKAAARPPDLTVQP